VRRRELNEKHLHLQAAAARWSGGLFLAKSIDWRDAKGGEIGRKNATLPI
jgi:hypothetical protein